MSALDNLPLPDCGRLLWTAPYKFKYNKKREDRKSALSARGMSAKMRFKKHTFIAFQAKSRGRP